MSNFGKGYGEGSVELNTSSPGSKAAGSGKSTSKVDGVKESVKAAVHATLKK